MSTYNPYAYFAKAKTFKPTHAAKDAGDRQQYPTLEQDVVVIDDDMLANTIPEKDQISPSSERKGLQPEIHRRKSSAQQNQAAPSYSDSGDLTGDSFPTDYHFNCNQDLEGNPSHMRYDGSHRRDQAKKEKYGVPFENNKPALISFGVSPLRKEVTTKMDHVQYASSNTPQSTTSPSTQSLAPWQIKQPIPSPPISINQQSPEQYLCEECRSFYEILGRKPKDSPTHKCGHQSSSKRRPSTPPGFWSLKHDEFD